MLRLIAVSTSFRRPHCQENDLRASLLALLLYLHRQDSILLGWNGVRILNGDDCVSGLRILLRLAIHAGMTPITGRVKKFES
jgi:hypothetical protein